MNTTILGVLTDEKLRSLEVCLLVTVCVVFSGCTSKVPHSSEPSGTGSASSPSSSPSASQAAVPSSQNAASPYNIKDVVSPVSSDASASYKTTELTFLDQQFKNPNVSGIYFLDDSTILFSVKNGKTDDSSGKGYDLYRNNLKINVRSLLYSGFMLYPDDTATVKDRDNFSILNGGGCLKIENGKMKERIDFIGEATKKGIALADAFYNEQAGKLLYTESVNGQITGAYVANMDFSSLQKLPFAGIYRVQWADSSHVLAAYKDGNKSLLANYGLVDHSTVLTTLPENNFFIDPQICDNGLIRFFYLEPQDPKMPWGFLDQKTGSISRVLFDSANPVSILRNNRMADFSQSGAFPDITSRLYLYDLTSNKSAVRATLNDFPDVTAVSPDGSTIVYVSHTIVNNKPVFKFFINTIN